MPKTRRLSPALAALLLGLVFPLVASADALDAIIERGTLRVGVSLFVPWTMRGTAGHLEGFEVEVGEKLATDMGVKADFRVYPWQGLIPALEQGEVDVILGGMAITPERALRVTFTRPYAESGIALATHTGKTRDIQDLRALNAPDKQLAVVAKTASAELVRQFFDRVQVRTFPTMDAAKAALLAGEVHGLVASMPQPRFIALEHPDTVDLPLSEPLVTYRAGMAIARGRPELLNFLNAWITARSADKWLAYSHRYWFESLNWQRYGAP